MLYSINWQNLIIWLPLLLDILDNMCIQAFIQALSSTAVFPQRFSFFSLCLFQWLDGVEPW